eukprot:583950-Rhodomonas_salina.1
MKAPDDAEKATRNIQHPVRDDPLANSAAAKPSSNFHDEPGHSAGAAGHIRANNQPARAAAERPGLLRPGC